MTSVSDSEDVQGLNPGRKSVALTVLVLLTIHAGLLGWGATRHSPAWDEVGHFSAGISHWHLGQFILYRVNPPLVRMVATMPVVLAGPKTDWHELSEDPWAREQWPYGRQLADLNGPRYFRLLTVARWACIPFSLLGAVVCFWWARDLYGPLAGLLALTLWCFSPNILAHAQFITPDAGATGLGVAAAYAFWWWLKDPTWGRKISAGLMLGLAELTKMTWLVLFLIWPLLWMVWRWPSLRSGPNPQARREVVQLIVILLLGLSVLNLGYGSEGSFQLLGDYRFASKTFTGTDDNKLSRSSSENRFAGTWLGKIPVPLPKCYLMGIDAQKFDFESNWPSYLRGEWRRGGWWYYYLYGLAIKVPLGTWGLLFTALLVGSLGRGYASSWRDELCLLVPIAVILTLVSSQTGINHHLRYVLPIFPFAFIWASKIAQAVKFRARTVCIIAAAGLLWSVTSSLWYYPHNLSYFNELVGGPKEGHFHLGSSNIDWGQDLFYLKRWMDEHPEATPIYIACDSALVPHHLGIKENGRPPAGPPAVTSLPDPDHPMGPVPGWYAASVYQIHGETRELEYFLEFEPVAMAGYSIYIYHITLEDANRVRRLLGCAELPSDGQAKPGKARHDRR